MKEEHFQKLHEYAWYFCDIDDLSLHVDSYHQSLSFTYDHFSFDEDYGLWSIYCDLRYNNATDQVIALTDLRPGERNMVTDHPFIDLEDLSKFLPEEFRKIIKSVYISKELNVFCFEIDMNADLRG